jgi:hypothetical protein
MVLKVQDRSPAVDAMAQHWPLVEALLGGTSAMRAAKTQFLPKWPNEDQESYDMRVGTATLFPALARTISVMGGKPFSKQLVLSEETPEQIAEWLENADMQGNNLHSVLSDVFSECLGFGVCGILVDHGRKPDEVRTKEQEAQLGLRPYLVFIRHHQILGWKAERRNGALMLTQLRLAECLEEPDGAYGIKYRQRVRVLEPGRFELWQEGEKKDDAWFLVDEGTTTLGIIPFVPFYGKKLGLMEGVSPLLDLAHLNVKHWQSQSDQDTIIHVARVPILALIGAEQGIPDGKGGMTPGTQLTVGAKSAVSLPVGGDMKFVEHSGAAIDAGAKSLEALEAQMVTTGAELLVVKPGEAKSATQSNNEAEANKSDLQRMVENAEDAADQVLQLMAMWVGEQDGGNVTLFKDFGAGSLSDASAQLVLSMQQGGLITKETALKEMQRRGTISPDVDPSDELEKVDSEGPSLGNIGTNPPAEDNKDA